ncbi:response regulator [Hymenobacter sp. 15J16-1T3B]|uniref:response regulator n=1 Tax=Hymenobacter sp. 15J16-1T3B TaxID=2886941 RepID=UPI001D0FFEAE|nr:response regulator [Hymenobacter sp. 15J16-1T3B]MCC3155627.1 response regulator [Hymenobacter sp. 15J16-1T3B]
MSPEPLRILVVEDELLVAADLQEALERQGYEVPAAVRSGEAALQVLPAVRPDLVLLDINLRGQLTGIETAARIRAALPVPFIFLTGLADRATLDQALAEHPAAYLVKPFVERDLGIAIDLAVRNFRQAAEAPAAALAPEAAEPQLTADSVFVRHQGRHVRVAFDDILFIEAQGNYCRLVTRGGEYLLTVLLGQLLPRLPLPTLLRVHRSFALNLRHVSAFDELRAVVGGHEVPIGAAYRAELLRHLPTL